jgi:hypothetical protein
VARLASTLQQHVFLLFTRTRLLGKKKGAINCQATLTKRFLFTASNYRVLKLTHNSHKLTSFYLVLGLATWNRVAEGRFEPRKRHLPRSSKVNTKSSLQGGCKQIKLVLSSRSNVT